MNPFGSKKPGKTFLFTSESVGEGHSGKYKTFSFMHYMLTCADITVNEHLIYYTVALLTF